MQRDENGALIRTSFTAAKNQVLGTLFSASFYQGNANGYTYLAMSYNIQGIVIYGTRPAPATTPDPLAADKEPYARGSQPSAKSSTRPRPRSLARTSTSCAARSSISLTPQ